MTVHEPDLTQIDVADDQSADVGSDVPGGDTPVSVDAPNFDEAELEPGFAPDADPGVAALSLPDTPDLVLDATDAQESVSEGLGGWGHDDDEDAEASVYVPSPYDRPGRWYVVHTYSGYENKVKSNLANVVASREMEDQVFEVVIPMEDVVEFKGGKKVTVQKKVFPGYLLVRCDLDDDAWGAIRNTPGVTGFVGPGTKPTPLSRREVENILQVKPEGAEAPTKRSRPRLEYEVDETVRVKEAPSPTSRARSPRSTRTSSSSRCWSTSSAGRPRSSSSSARSRSSSARRNVRKGKESTWHRRSVSCAVVKIQLEAGRRTPAPPVGTALGPHGVQTMEFCKQYNAATENQRGTVIPVEITIYEDRSFTFVLKTPPTPVLLRQAAGWPRARRPPGARRWRP